MNDGTRHSDGLMEKCLCGHSAYWHGNFSTGKCGQCDCRQFKGEHPTLQQCDAGFVRARRRTLVTHKAQFVRFCDALGLSSKMADADSKQLLNFVEAMLIHFGADIELLIRADQDRISREDERRKVEAELAPAVRRGKYR